MSDIEKIINDAWENKDQISPNSDYKQFPCNCKSKNCCGYIVRTESRWRINKKFKKNLGINR